MTTGVPLYRLHIYRELFVSRRSNSCLHKSSPRVHADDDLQNGAFINEGILRANPSPSLLSPLTVFCWLTLFLVRFALPRAISTLCSAVLPLLMRSYFPFASVFQAFRRRAIVCVSRLGTNSFIEMRVFEQLV